MNYSGTWLNGTPEMLARKLVIRSLGGNISEDGVITVDFEMCQIDPLTFDLYFKLSAYTNLDLYCRI